MVALPKSVLFGRPALNEPLPTLQQLHELAAHWITGWSRFGPEGLGKGSDNLLVQRIGFGFALGLGKIAYPSRIQNTQR
jgi:hypothetical protein